jgi:ABC-type antimicrobial peptide transport system permease subunit
MTSARAFLRGILIGLFLFILANLLAAHLLSDCGLPSIFGMDFCADDIARAGFPFIFFEEGGFAYRSIFNIPNLLLDIFIGIGFAVVCGLIGNRRKKRNP